MMYCKNVFILLTFLFFNEVATYSALEHDFDFYTNRCDQFTGHLPDTFLDQCPQAKFMTRDDYECYDRSYKQSMYVFCIYL